MATQNTVLIGGTGDNFVGLANSHSIQQLLKNENIGLYMHANGMAALSPSQRAMLWQTWASTGVTSTGQGDAVGEVGGFELPDAGYLSYFGGKYPDRVNMNILTNSGNGTGIYVAQIEDSQVGTAYSGYTTVDDLKVMKIAIDAAKSAGAKTVAIFMTPNGGGEDLADRFSIAPYWANVRAAAMYGGGLALDVPPSYWIARGPAYQSLIRQMLSWAAEAGLRTSMTVSPYALTPDASGNVGSSGFDADFLKNTRLLVADLKKASPPTEWVVENYSPGGTMNDIGADGSIGTLNEVALWIADYALQDTDKNHVQTVVLEKAAAKSVPAVNNNSTTEEPKINIADLMKTEVVQSRSAVHIRPVAVDAQSDSYKSDLRPDLAFSNSTTGQQGVAKLDYVDAGGPDYLKWNYIMSGTDNIAFAAAVPNVFIHGGSGNDAIAVQTGSNVLDGGSGSNFLHGGSGTDTFFTDLRPTEVTWSTMVNFHQGDRATIWGYKDGISSMKWRFYNAEAGKDGLSGATLDINVDGGLGRNGSGIDASITFAGLSVAQASSMLHSSGSSLGDGSYLSFYNQGV